MKSLILLLLCLFPVSISGSTDAVCVSKNLQFCQLLFNQELNVTSSQADWSNPGTLAYILQKYYLQGFDGLLTVCHARTKFAQCLGDQYDSCLSELHFVSSGQSPDNARDYVQIFKTLEFDCDGGFIQSSRNWPCIAYILQTNDATLTTCKQNYIRDITQNPSNVCSSATTFESCVRAPFAKCGVETSWWECERTRRGYSIDQLCPKSSCNFEASSSSMDSVQSFFDDKSAHGQVLKDLASRQKF